MRTVRTFLLLQEGKVFSDAGVNRDVLEPGFTAASRREDGLPPEPPASLMKEKNESQKLKDCQEKYTISLHPVQFGNGRKWVSIRSARAGFSFCCELARRGKWNRYKIKMGGGRCVALGFPCRRCFFHQWYFVDLRPGFHFVNWRTFYSHF